jgi:hypothetical protein
VSRVFFSRESPANDSREDLSISLNFRPNHHCSTVKLRMHQLLVIFGFRRAICSHLRSAILPDPAGPVSKPLINLMDSIAQPHTAPCYFILCDGTLTVVIEKELIGAKIRTSKEFIVHTNHDTRTTDPMEPAQKEKNMILGLETFIEESEERRACMQKKWDSLRKRHEKKLIDAVEKGEAVELKSPSVKEDRLREWVRAYPIMNECSHFGCIMDPKTATIRFLERGAEDDRL